MKCKKKIGRLCGKIAGGGKICPIEKVFTGGDVLLRKNNINVEYET